MTTQPVTWTDSDRASWRHAATLSDMRGWWTGSDCVVVAGGPSARDTYTYTSRMRWVIACNRAANWCGSSGPDFVACFEPRKDTDVWDAVKDSPAFMLSHIDRDHPRTIRTRPKQDVRPWITGESLEARKWGTLTLGQSTFFAIAAALVLGFETIGVIGLDLTEDRYDVSLLRDSEAAYSALQSLAEAQGRKIVNLNPDSRLRSLRKGGWSSVREK